MTTTDSSIDELVRECAREWLMRGSGPPPLPEEEATLVTLDGRGFLAHRLGRRPTPHEMELFWSVVETR